MVLVPPGSYSVIAAKGGYQPVEKQVAGEIQNIDINLDRQDDRSSDSAPVVAPS